MVSDERLFVRVGGEAASMSLSNEKLFLNNGDGDSSIERLLFAGGKLGGASTAIAAAPCPLDAPSAGSI
jgi:hypothetical protein